MTVTATIPQIPFLADWDRQLGAERQAAYVDAEVRRLVAAGERLLLAILSLPFPEQANAVRAAAARHAPAVWLRLAPGASPPHLDPQGRPLAPADRGTLLVAKVGTLGAAPEASAAARAEWSAPGRQLRSRQGRDLYLTREVRADRAELVPLGEALEVYRQWGRYVHPTGRKPVDRIRGLVDTQFAQAQEMWRARGYIVEGDAVYRDMWLVEQTDAAGRALPVAPAAEAAPPEPRRGKAA